MTWDTARQAIDFALDHTLSRSQALGTPREAQIGFFGGEPLMEWGRQGQASKIENSEAGEPPRGLIQPAAQLWDEGQI